MPLNTLAGLPGCLTPAPVTCRCGWLPAGWLHAQQQTRFLAAVVPAHLEHICRATYGFARFKQIPTRLGRGSPAALIVVLCGTTGPRYPTLVTLVITPTLHLPGYPIRCRFVVGGRCPVTI